MFHGTTSPVRCRDVSCVLDTLLFGPSLRFVFFECAYPTILCCPLRRRYYYPSSTLLRTFGLPPFVLHSRINGFPPGPSASHILPVIFFPFRGHFHSLAKNSCDFSPLPSFQRMAPFPYDKCCSYDVFSSLIPHLPSIASLLQLSSFY